jgi:methylated-DNA-[protein]-cysteine S-methyltransferase
MSKEKPKNGNRTRVVPAIASFPVKLPRGWASAVESGGKFAAVEWEERKETLLAVLKGKYPGVGIREAETTASGRYLLAYSGGKTPLVREIEALPIAWEKVPGYHRTVLRQTAAIPYGKTVTYGELAAMTGNPRAFRAVGRALARNPWPVVVPCHRVVGSGGKLVGFGKGIETKRALLDFERRSLGSR